MMWRIFRLELRVAFRHSAEIANPLWFFLIVITLFPLEHWAGTAATGTHCAGHHLGLRRCWRHCWRWNACFVMICRTAALSN